MICQGAETHRFKRCFSIGVSVEFIKKRGVKWT